jgi:sigma-B regulation protein RsbU (phosphoserine phosphatase)
MVGMFADARFESVGTALGDGDSILVHTDGITDAENMAHEMFGKKRLANLICSLASHDGAGEPSATVAMAQRVIEEVRDFTSGASQADDITLLAVRYGGRE